MILMQLGHPEDNSRLYTTDGNENRRVDQCTEMNQKPMIRE